MSTLYEITRQLHKLQPDDPKTLMLRAILNDKIEKSIKTFEARCAEVGVRSYEILPYRVRFHPYLNEKPLQYVMAVFDVKNSSLPIRLPPAYWGERTISPPQESSA